jgi:hypothetical protein
MRREDESAIAGRGPRWASVADADANNTRVARNSLDMLNTLLEGKR